MNPIFYLLILLVLFTVLLYPLFRKAVSLLEIFVHKYIQQSVRSESAGKPDDQNSTLQTMIHLKLLAYERIVLLIERLKPDSLIPRTLAASMTVHDYQLLLLNEIRQEFEYNLSQQLYLSENAWSVTLNFKDSVITLVNGAAAECKPTEPASQLAKKVLSLYINSDLKADQILKMIKADIR